MENIIIKDTRFSEYEARIKLLVLSYSLTFENLASQFLIKALKFDESAISMGNTSQALSMNQKVTLLLDTKLLDKDHKKYFKTFIEIRNQFMHNAAVKSIEDCLSFLDGAELFIEKAYRKKKEVNEKAGGARAAKEKADEELNDRELQNYDVNNKEKLLYKYWISLAEDVIIGFEKMLKRI